jgi:hypothetical protein
MPQKRACIADGPSITQPLIAESSENCGTSILQSTKSASDENIQPNMNNHFPDTEPAKLPLTEQQKIGRSKACHRCHRLKIKCGPFPCQRCQDSGSECTEWKRKLKWQDTPSHQSPFRPITTYTSIPTAVPNLWMDPGLGAEFPADTQCGNHPFPKVRQDWNDPMNKGYGFFEQADFSEYSY